MKDREDLAELFTNTTQEEFFEMDNLLSKTPETELLNGVEPKRRRISWYKVSDLAARAVLLGSIGASAGYGVVSFAYDQRADKESVRYYDYDPNIGNPLLQIEEFIKYPESNPPDQQTVNDFIIATYHLGREGMGAISDFEMATNADEDDRRDTFEKQNKVVLLGAEIVKKLDPEKDVKIDAENGLISYDNKEFRLDDPKSFFFLDEMLLQNIDMFDNSETLQERYLASKNLDDLRWLLDSEVKIEFQWEDLGVLPRGSLVNMARIYRTFDQLGYEDLPKDIKYVPHLVDQELGYAGGIYMDWEETIEISKNSGPNTVVHEEGHHVQARFEQYSQDKFDSIVNLAKQRVGNEFEVGDTFIDPSERNLSIPTEDYATTFDKYFSDGVAFRKRIIELEKKSPAAAEILQAKYNFMKAVFKGKEFSRDGREVDIQLGDVISISDPDGKALGISLRQAPIIETLATNSLVYDGDLLEILGEGIVVFTPDGESRTLYNVALVTLDEKTGILERKEYGWVWDKWFGYEVLTNEARQELVD